MLTRLLGLVQQYLLSYPDNTAVYKFIDTFIFETDNFRETHGVIISNRTYKGAIFRATTNSYSMVMSAIHRDCSSSLEQIELKMRNIVPPRAPEGKQGEHRWPYVGDGSYT